MHPIEYHVRGDALCYSEFWVDALVFDRVIYYRYKTLASFFLLRFDEWLWHTNGGKLRTNAVEEIILSLCGFVLGHFVDASAEIVTRVRHWLGRTSSCLGARCIRYLPGKIKREG